MRDPSQERRAARILVVEDELLVAKDLEQSLKALGYEVVGAVASGEGAVSLAGELHPDLALMDITLRGQIDGIEAADRIRANFDIPVVYLTAYEEEDLLRRSKKTEPYGYLGKPVSLLELQSTIETAVYKHEADKRVKESEELYRNLANLSPDGIFIQEGDRFVLANESMARILRLDRPEELVGERVLDFVHPDFRDAVAERFRENTEQNKHSPLLEQKLVRKDGTFVDVEAAASPLPFKGRRARQVVVRDITARKKAEQSLRDSEEKYRRLHETMMDAFVYVDMSGRIQETNRAYRDMLDYSEQELQRLTYKDLTPKKWHSFEARIVEEQILAKGYSDVYQKEYRKKDGTVFPVELRTFLVRDEEGRPQAMWAIVRDISERLQAEKAVRESEGRYRGLFENMLEGFAYCKMIYEDGKPLDLVYLEVNDSFGALTGLKNVIGKKVTEVIPGVRQSNPELFEIYGRVASTGKPEKFETYVDPLGIWFSTSVYSSETGYFIAVFENISERKRAEEALKASEARVRMKLDSILLPEGDIGGLELGDVIDTATIQSLMDEFFSLTNIGVGIIDQAGKVLVATGWQEICVDFHRKNPETCRYCIESDTVLSAGVEAGTFNLYRCKNNMWDIATPIIVGGKHLGNLFLGQFLFEDEPPDYETFRSQARRYGFDEELYLAALDKVPRWTRETVNTVMAFYAKLAGILSTLSYSNIKLARSLAEQERLLNSQRRLATAVEQAAEAIVITDTQGNIEYVNPAHERITGYSRDEVIGRKPELLRNKDKFASMAEEAVDLVSGGGRWTGHLVQSRKDGTPYESEVTVSPVRDQKGSVVNYVWVKRDVTQEVMLQKQLVQSHKMEAIGTLAGGIAHDFNNLLQVVLGYSELLMSDEDLGASHRDDVRKIHQAAITGSDLVKRLLTFSRKTETKPKPLSLNRQIEGVAKLLSRTIPKMIAIELILAEDLNIINADSTQIEQILMNLAVNARDAMADGGRLVIETQNITLDEEYCRTHLATRPGAYVLLTVSDTGQGMDKKTLERVFEPFYTTKGPGEGTGLGLAMIYGIVRQHGGYITCYSEPGCGTTFKIYFPALISDSASGKERFGPVPRGGSETILLVDDEELICDLGARILTRAGYNVLTAENGKEALELYRQRAGEISLVILDVIMPEMGGKQCLEELSKLNPGLKAIVASGYSANAPTREAVAAGAQGFITKPYDMRQVLAIVRKVLDSP